MQQEPKQRKVIAQYHADVTVFGIASSLTVAGDITNPEIIRVLSERPEWMPFQWPETAPHSRSALESLALLKMLTIFEFGAGIEASDPQGIRDALLTMNPFLLREEASGTQDWKHVVVSAEIYDDGHFQGGFDYPEEGIAFPLRDNTEDTFDHFIKNLVRADIREMLDARMPEWQREAIGPR